MLATPLRTLGWIIVKAREFDVKDVGAHGVGDDESNPYGVLQDRADDPTAQELTSWITDLNEDQKAELVAIYWLGRDGGDAEDLRTLFEEADGQQGGTRAARYLLGSPMLADHLEAGLETLGYDVAEIEEDLG